MSFRFGIASEINIEKSTIAFCGTILFLVTFETITHKLEDFIGNSPTYNKMLQRIYKELMINGFVSFALSMYMALYPKEAHSEWIHVMEFCGYVLFFVAIFFVAHGLYIIGLSLFSAQQYDLYHSTPISDILQKITSVHQTWQEYLFDFRYLPFSSLRSVAEFKIIYALFRDTYWLPSNFDYGRYLSGCFERYSLRIVKIGKISWSVMFVLGIVNYLRVKYFGPHFFNCKGFKTASDYSHGGGHGGGSSHSLTDSLGEEEHHDDHHGDDGNLAVGGRYGITHACADVHLELFFACGLVMTLYVIAVYLFGRTYVIRLISHSGVTEIRDYGEFLALEESASLKTEDVRTFEINVEEGTDGSRQRNPNSRSRRMSINTLRNNLDRAVSQNESDKHHTETSGVSSLAVMWENISSYLSPRVRPVPSVPIHLSPRPSVSMPLSANTPQGHLSPAGSLRASRKNSMIVTLDRSGGNSMTRGDAEGLSSIEQFKLTKRNRGDPRSSGSGSNLVTDAFRRVTSLVDKRKVEPIPDLGPAMKLSEDFSHIYLFRSPDLYYWAVECCIVLNSLYLSFWMTNYITIVHYETSNTPFWQILMMCPLLIVMPLVGEIVKTASMLSAIAELEIDIMGSVLEHMEDQKLLLEQLRTSAKSRLSVAGPQLRTLLENLFNTIDYNHKGYLNKSDIREFFRALHLHYSNDKFNRLFFLIDHNKDGEISFSELYRLLCPSEVEEEDRKIRTEAVTKMNEVTREKPKGRVASIRSFLLPSSFVQPFDSDSPPESRKNSSWKWFGSGSKSDPDLLPTVVPPPELKGSYENPVIEEKEKDVEKADDDDDLAMEELRGHLETTLTSHQIHNSQPPASLQSPTYDGVVEIMDMDDIA